MDIPGVYTTFRVNSLMLRTCSKDYPKTGVQAEGPHPCFRTSSSYFA